MTTLYDSLNSGYTSIMSGFNPHLDNHLIMGSPSLTPAPVRAPPYTIGSGSGAPQVSERPMHSPREHSRHETTLARGGSNKAPTRMLLPRQPVVEERQAGLQVDGDGNASSVTNGVAESPDDKPKITTVACQECQRKKCKCDGARPSCRACARKGVLNCVYQDREDTTRKLRETNKQLKDDNQHLQDENTTLRKELEALKVRTNSMSSDHDKKETTRTELTNNVPPKSHGPGDATTMYNKTMEAHRRGHTYSPIRGSNDTWLPSMTEDQVMPLDNQNSNSTTAPPNLAGAAAAAVRTSENPSPASVKSNRSAASTSKPKPKPKKRSFAECSLASDLPSQTQAQQQPSPVDAPNKPANTSKPRKRTASRDIGTSGAAVQSLNDQQPMQWLKGQQPGFFTQTPCQQQQQQPVQQYPFPIQQHGHGNRPLFEHATSSQSLYFPAHNQDLFHQYRSAHPSFSLPTPTYTHHAHPAQPTLSTLNPSLMHQHEHHSHQPSTPVSPIPYLPHHNLAHPHHHATTVSPSVSSHPSAVFLASSAGSTHVQREALSVPRGQLQAHHLPDQQHGLLNGNHGLDMNALPDVFEGAMGIGPGIGMGMGLGLGLDPGPGGGVGMGGYSGFGDVHGYNSKGGGFPGA